MRVITLSRDAKGRRRRHGHRGTLISAVRELINRARVRQAPPKSRWQRSMSWGYWG
jgi:hypothetical protein